MNFKYDLFYFFLGLGGQMIGLRDSEPGFSDSSWSIWFILFFEISK